MNMRRVVFFLFLATFLSAVTGLGDDRIVTVDQQAKFLTVEQNGSLKLYRLTDTTDITVNGSKGSVQQLLPGQSVTVKLAGSITATKVAASGLASNPNSARPLALRTVTVQMRVDGSDRLFYQDGKLWIANLYANVFSMEHRGQII